MICIIRGEPSAVPKRWVGMIPAVGPTGLLPWAGRAVLDHVIDRARTQISELILCHAGDPSSLGGFGLPVVAPASEGLPAAVLAGLDWTAAHSRETPWVATFAADVPVFPSDLVERMGDAIGAQGADMAWAVYEGQPWTAFGLWPVRLRRALRRVLERKPAVGVEEWAAGFRAARVEFAAATTPFVGVRGTEDLTSAEPYIAPGPVGATVR